MSQINYIIQYEIQAISEISHICMECKLYCVTLQSINSLEFKISIVSINETSFLRLASLLCTEADMITTGWKISRY